MGKRLSVGNIPHQITGDELQALFAEAGAVASSRIFNYLHNGETRGYSFVAMQTQVESQKATAMFKGRLVDGRPLAVREDSAQPKCSFGRRGRKPNQLPADNLPGERK